MLKNKPLKFYLYTLFLWMGLSMSTMGKEVLVIPIDGAISPALSDFVVRGIRSATPAITDLIILRMDTPGGLDKSMRTIVKAILASTVPVVTYVAPSGARAASAGTFILYASHVAAMAPGTNIGAATPVSLGGDGGLPTPKSPTDKKAKDKKEETKKAKSQAGEAMKAKVTNDALAYIRSLAQLRKRELKFAKEAIQKAATVTAEEALKRGIIDYIASSIPQVIAKAHGRQVLLKDTNTRIKTTDATIRTLKKDWRTKLLLIITDPSIAYMLLLLGIYGIFFEFANPGFVVPGVVGAISMILALYALQMLPISYAGLGLIVLGVIFMVAEIFVPSFGALGFGGIIAFVVGSVFLIDTNVAGYGLSWPLILTMSITNAVVILGLIGMAIRSRRSKLVSSVENIMGQSGVVLADCEGMGQAKINGEIWKIRSNSPLKAGEHIRVTGREGLDLQVAPQPKEDR